MDIDRNIDILNDDSSSPKDKVSFCLNWLEKEEFADGINWDTCITPRLTLLEMIGALVSSEQFMKEIEENEIKEND